MNNIIVNGCGGSNLIYTSLVLKLDSSFNVWIWKDYVEANIELIQIWKENQKTGQAN